MVMEHFRKIILINVFYYYFNRRQLVSIIISSVRTTAVKQISNITAIHWIY